MKQALFLLFILVLSGCNSRVPEESVNTAICCKEKRFHIEDAYSDKLYSFEFILLNQCDTTVTINDIEVSCNCVVLKNIPKYVKPNSSASISGILDTKNQHGFIDKTIFVSYNNEGLLILRVSADVN